MVAAVSPASSAVSVLHVAQSSEYGLGRIILDCVRAQVQAGWQVSIAGDPNSTLVVQATRAGATWEPWLAQRQPYRGIFRETQKLGAIVRRIDPDVVHLWSSKAGMIGRLLLRGTKPTLFSPQGWSFEALPRTSAWMAVCWERLASRWGTVIVCCSALERARGEQLGIKGRMVVIPNAVDTSRLRSSTSADRRAARFRLGIAEETKLVISAGRLAAQKGHEILLRQWPIVYSRVPGARLAILGDGPQRIALEGLASEGVMFIGQTDLISDWLVAANVVAQPSRYEGMSLVVLEAMAAGRSVVATDVSGMREALIDASSGAAAGALVPTNEPAALATAIIRRLADSELADREGKVGTLRAKAFDLIPWQKRLLRLTRDCSLGLPPDCKATE
jgi:glycosyltransferase involved in cell wall biosynthesis